jgi:hypothetical protein
MTIDKINAELYAQSKNPDESRACMESQVCRLRVLLREGEMATLAARLVLEQELQRMARSCESERGGLELLGDVDWNGLHIHWAAVYAAHQNFRDHEDAVAEMRRQIDDKLGTLADAALWEKATNSDTLTKSFAWSRIREAL